MNAKAKNKYLYDILMANVGESTQTASPTPQPSAPAKQEPAPYKGKVEMPAPIPDKEGFQDLPF